MGRIRAIKPGYFLNEELAECGCESMILFAGLWTLADREGRLEDRPKRIKAQIFPYMDVHLDTLMDTLGQNGFISRYSVDGQKYVQIHNWHRHQKPHHTEKESVIPSMDTSTDNSPLEHGEHPEGNGLMGNGLMGNGDEAKRAAERFEQFWEAYPRKVKKIRAEKVWNKIKPDEELFGDIMAGLEAYIAGEWKGQDRHWLPYPSSWLNDKQWKDEVLGPRKNGHRPVIPGWKIEKMLKAIRMTQDTFTGKRSISDEEWDHCLRAFCNDIGLQYTEELYRLATEKA